MTNHYLKTWQPYFDKVATGIKKFEVRKNDRDFKVGDNVILQEYDPIKKDFTGREIGKKITYILYGGDFGIENGYCVLQMI